MSSVEVETFLARLYTEKEFLEKFQENPTLVLENWELTESERNSILEMDLYSLELAAHSFRVKKSFVEKQKKKFSRLQTIKNWLVSFFR